MCKNSKKVTSSFICDVVKIEHNLLHTRNFWFTRHVSCACSAVWNIVISKSEYSRILWNIFRFDKTKYRCLRKSHDWNRRIVYWSTGVSPKIKTAEKPSEECRNFWLSECCESSHRYNIMETRISWNIVDFFRVVRSLVNFSLVTKRTKHMSKVREVVRKCERICEDDTLTLLMTSYTQKVTSWFLDSNF